MSSEKRSKARLIVTEEVLVRDCLSNLLLGKLANIHDEGFMVIGNGDFQEDAFYQVQFEGANAAVRADAECLWTSETGSGDHLWAGFTFLNIHAEDQEKFHQMVKLFEP